VRKIQTQVLLIVTVILIGFTMFSMANATTPEENKAAGTAFLAENAKKPNIVTTATGLQYEVLTAGTGTTSPSATDNVTVHYKGTTLNGEEFDSSYSRGEPATFPLNRVIAGWTEGVQLMKEGAKYRFYIPSELAYGAQGAGRSIGPNAALIFDVELIKIQ
jgi:FKBP-type peptidyl-prolyl cis-trans isomerase